MAASATAAGLFHRELGSGEATVLVHDSWSENFTWQLVSPELAPDLRVIAYDRRGHGRSLPHDGPRLARRRHEDDLAALIERVAGGSAHLVGNSYGASVALGLAVRRPELVRSVSAHEPLLFGIAHPDSGVERAAGVLGAVGRTIDAGEFEAAARDFAEKVAIGPGAWPMIPHEVREAMIRNAPAFAAEVHDPDWAHIDLRALDGLQMPVLLTQGDMSLPWFAPIMTSLAGAIPHRRLVTIEGAGHVPHLTHPDEYAAIVRSFAMTAKGTL
jgi:pimeloyl-ACP methyl ester carboxylesterase